MRVILLAMLALGAAAAFADQAQVIGLEEAEYATAMLEPGREIRHYCAPCEDTRWRPEVVGSVEAVPWKEEEGMVELKVNGEGVDCAYIYFYQSGRWLNLAKFLGLEVTGVPNELQNDVPANSYDEFDETAIPQVKGFSRTHFRGKVGDKAVLAELAFDGKRLTGVYRYGHVQAPIAVYGERVEEGSAFALKEYAEGKKSGEWRVSLTPGTLALDGEWVSPDESKKLPLKLQPYAVSVQGNSTFEAGAIRWTSSWDYPLFTASGHPHAKEVNAKLGALVSAETARRSVEEAAAGEEAWEAFGENLTGSEDMLGSYRIVHCSDTFVSISMESYSFGAGAAHGNSGTLAMNLAFDKEGMREAKVGDFLAKGEESIKALSELLIAELKQQQAFEVVQGNITEFAEKDLPNFTASPKGLTFHFDPYAVGPYAEGPFTVDVPWEALGAHAKKTLVE